MAKAVVPDKIASICEDWFYFVNCVYLVNQSSQLRFFLRYVEKNVLGNNILQCYFLLSADYADFRGNLFSFSRVIRVIRG